MTRSEKYYLVYSFIFGLILFLSTSYIAVFNPISRLSLNEDSEQIVQNAPERNELADLNNPNVAGTSQSTQSEIRIEEKPSIIVKESENYRPPPLTSCEEVGKINTQEKIVVFTFDADGRDRSINQILKAFSDRGLKTTFFVEGRWTRQFPEHVKAIDEAGHEIFNHSNTHPRFTELTDAEVRRELADSDETIYKITGKTTKPFFRPPYGERDDRVRKVVCDTGFQTIVWSIDAWDWREYKGVTAQEVKDRVIGSLQPGNIILMHTGNTLAGAVIGDLLDTVQSLGYKVLPYTEAIESK